MKAPQGPLANTKSLKALAHRFAFMGLIAATFALMLIGKADTIVVERIRTAANDAVTPILSILAQPAATLSDVMSNVRELSNIREENAALKESNERLLEWQAIARQLEAENRDLRAKLNVVEEPSDNVVTARVVADTGGAFAQSLLISAGSRQAVAKGNAVKTDQGLVGRITESGRLASRVLLLTDINSRVPVRVGEAGIKAVLAGDNSDRPALQYQSGIGSVNPGDRVVTSGDAAAFPPGVPVGMVALGRDGTMQVDLFAVRDQLRFVSVVDYGLTGILTDPSGGN